MAALLASSFTACSDSKPPPINGARLVAAARAYRQSLETQKQPVPAEVRVEELVNRGWLRAEDVRTFAGLDARISLAADASRPQEVLMRVRFPGGEEIVTLADGSVQRVSPKSSRPSSL
jgi:hypothetical protein